MEGHGDEVPVTAAGAQHGGATRGGERGPVVAVAQPTFGLSALCDSCV